MTEQEIIKAWKNNEFMAFGGMPIECQEWAKERKDRGIWFIGGDPSAQSIRDIDRYSVYGLTHYYQHALKPLATGWVELDIREEGYELPLQGGRVAHHWQCWYLSRERGLRTLTDGRVLTKFDGWYWPERGCYSVTMHSDTNGIPKKIRFWAERIES